MEVIKTALDANLIWHDHPTNIKYFYTTFENELLLLRLNNFPDEPLLTVIYKIDIMDVEDVPKKWKMPFHK